MVGETARPSLHLPSPLACRLPSPRLPCMIEGVVRQALWFPSPRLRHPLYGGRGGDGHPLTPASPPLSHFRGEGSWKKCVRRSWLCKLLRRRKLPLSPSLRRGRGGRGVRGSGLGIAFTTSLQPGVRSSPHPGCATPCMVEEAVMGIPSPRLRHPSPTCGERGCGRSV